MSLLYSLGIAERAPGLEFLRDTTVPPRPNLRLNRGLECSDLPRVRCISLCSHSFAVGVAMEAGEGAKEGARLDLPLSPIHQNPPEEAGNLIYLLPAAVKIETSAKSQTGFGPVRPAGY